MRLLLDTDVILDVLLDRPEFVQAAAMVWEAKEQGRIDAYISAITPVNVFYIARKLKGRETARQIAATLLQDFRVCPLDHATLEIAHSLPLSDFEDAVQLASAQLSNLDALVTRNVRDYQNATLPIFSPPELIARLAGKE